MAKVVAVVSVSFIFISYFLPCIAMMPGGISIVDQPLNSTEIMEGLHIFLRNVNLKENRALQANCPNCLYKRICYTLQASVQVVQGALYCVALKVVPVDKQLDHESCIPEDDLVLLAKGGERFVCFTIWSRPWLKEEFMRFIVKEKAADDYESCLQVNS